VTITVSTADKRSVKALAILATSDRWIRGHRKADGRSFWAVPSASDPSRVYMVDTRECTCPDFIHRGATCAHILAARLRVAQLNAERPKARRAAKADTFTSAQPIDGMAADLARRPRPATLADSIWGVDGE
jgi:predicted nucleic acid-binding Zn finger protein